MVIIICMIRFNIEHPLHPSPGVFEGPRSCCRRHEQGQGHQNRAHRDGLGGRSPPPPPPPLPKAISKAVGALAILKARGVVFEGTSKEKDTRTEPTDMVLGVAKEAEAGIFKVPGGTRVKTLNPWDRS